MYHFCRDNRELVIERNADGEIIIMSPTGGRNVKIAFKLEGWNELQQTGIVFDSSTGFVLPNGAMRAPDAAWVARERWQSLTAEEQEQFPPLCPDFVIAVRSSSDKLKKLQKKMREWIQNGCRLAWLIDADEEKVYLYRPEQAMEIVSDFDRHLSGEAILPGFILDLTILRFL